MSEPFVGEIRMFAGTFAPRAWAFCDGQLQPVSQNDALFSLLGTIYGGDGRTTFGLPDLRGRLPIHEGDGPGLSSRRLGAKGGLEKVTVTVKESPSHTHQVTASTSRASSKSPAGNVLANAKMKLYASPGTQELQPMNSNAMANTGGSQSHDNMMPYLCVNFIIALYGIYPSRH